MGVRKESRHYSRELKRDVVLLVFEKGVPVRNVALLLEQQESVGSWCAVPDTGIGKIKYI